MTRPSTPPPRTKWTRRVPHPVLIGHAASLGRMTRPSTTTSCGARRSTPKTCSSQVTSPRPRPPPNPRPPCAPRRGAPTPAPRPQATGGGPWRRSSRRRCRCSPEAGCPKGAVPRRAVQKVSERPVEPFETESRSRAVPPYAPGLGAAEGGGGRGSHPRLTRRKRGRGGRARARR